MNPILHIRTEVLKCTQSAFAAIAGTRQATVSRWERGELHPDLVQLSAIRNEVIAQGKPWDDRWFFEHPTNDVLSSTGAAA